MMIGSFSKIQMGYTRLLFLRNFQEIIFMLRVRTMSLQQKWKISHLPLFWAATTTPSLPKILKPSLPSFFNDNVDLVGVSGFGWLFRFFVIFRCFLANVLARFRYFHFSTVVKIIKVILRFVVQFR